MRVWKVGVRVPPYPHVLLLCQSKTRTSYWWSLATDVLRVLCPGFRYISDFSALLYSDRNFRRPPMTESRMSGIRGAKTLSLFVCNRFPFSQSCVAVIRQRYRRTDGRTDGQLRAAIPWMQRAVIMSATVLHQPHIISHIRPIQFAIFFQPSYFVTSI